MASRLILIRGINVGGRNQVAMPRLRTALEDRGYDDVATHLNSGNLLLSSSAPKRELAADIEKTLVREFTLDDEVIRVLVLTPKELGGIVDDRPGGFGDEPSKYFSDTIFLMGIPLKTALNVFDPQEGVDALWPGNGVIYHRRLSAQRTKTRLGRAMSTEVYKSMTIRSWSTTLKLRTLLDRHGA